MLSSCVVVASSMQEATAAASMLQNATPPDLSVMAAFTPSCEGILPCPSPSTAPRAFDNLQVTHSSLSAHVSVVSRRLPHPSCKRS